MSVFRSIVFSAVVAGGFVGIVVTAAQQFGTIPLILKAEVYERAADQAASKSTVVASTEHGGHDEDSWQPKDGFERQAFTIAANVLTAIGYGLFLAGIFALLGRPVGWREGLL